MPAVTVWMQLLMVPVGVAAGVLNFAAAGGSLLPFLVLTWLGFPPLVANATTLAATPLSFVAAAKEIKSIPRVMVVPLVFSVGATAVGVWIVGGLLSEQDFRRTVPFFLILSVIVLLTFRRVKDHIETGVGQARMSDRARLVTLTTGFTLTSAYAGAFGGGVAVMILGLGGWATKWPWPVMQLVKRVLCLFTSVVGLIAWAATGLVVWPACAVLGVSMVMGSLVGKWATDRIPDSTQRLIIAAITMLSAGYLWATQ